MKKLITILLSVLCLFSIVGINVSAEETQIEVVSLAIFDGDDVKDNRVRQKKTDGSYKELEPLVYGNILEDGEYCYLQDMGRDMFMSCSLNDRLDKNIAEKMTYYVMFKNDNVILNSYLSNIFDTGENVYFITDDGRMFRKAESTTVGAKEYTIYRLKEVKPADEIAQVNIVGINTNARDELTKYANVKVESINISKETVLYPDAVRCADLQYIDADMYDKALKTEDPNDDDPALYAVHYEKLNYGTRYYCVLALAIDEKFNESKVTYEMIRVTDSNGIEQKVLEFPPKAEEDLSSSLEKGKKGLSVYFEFKTEPDTKSVTLKYSVGEEYQWVITNNIGDDVTGGTIWVGQNVPPQNNTEVNVEVKEINVLPYRALKITVDSLNAENDVFKMTTKEGKTVDYQITGTMTDPNKIWKDGNKTVVLKAEKPASATGVFSWKNGAPLAAGEYEDTLTFTAEIAPLEKGDLIYFDNDTTDGKTNPYRVVKLEEKDVIEVLAMEQYGDEKIAYRAVGDKTPSYNGSQVDNAINEFLKYSVTNKKVTDAMIPSNSITVNKYGSVSSTPVKVEDLSRTAYALDISDLVEYFGTTSIKSEELSEFANIVTPIEEFKGHSIWLRSLKDNDSVNKAWYFGLYSNTLETRIQYGWFGESESYYTFKEGVHPAFRIQYKAIDYSYLPE